MNEVTKHQRSLLVVSYLAELAVPELRWLYRWLEDNAVDVARMLSNGHYGTFSALEGDDATYAGFLGRLQVLATAPQVQAIDVFLHVHGDPGSLAFKGGDKRTSDIEQDLRELELGSKLRALYSSACYGRTHIDCFVRGGFRVAGGAVGVNANAAAEYPLFIASWLGNKRFKSALGAIPIALTMLQDQIARLKFPDTNSSKEIGGRAYTRITTPAE